MKTFARLAGWATLAFVIAWPLHAPYQRILAALAGRLAAPRGTEIEWVALELFYPFDLSVFAALCLASAWEGWPSRLRALAAGVPVLMAIELVGLVVAMKLLIASGSQAPPGPENAQRLVAGLLRVVGLVAAAAVWFYLLGWRRLPQLAPGRASRRTSYDRRRP